MEKKKIYLELNCIESELMLIQKFLSVHKINYINIDILFKPEDYVDGNMERGHLNKSGWDKLFNKK